MVPLGVHLDTQVALKKCPAYTASMRRLGITFRCCSKFMRKQRSRNDLISAPLTPSHACAIVSQV
jgi:hypothetical protein